MERKYQETKEKKFREMQERDGVRPMNPTPFIKDIPQVSSPFFKEITKERENPNLYEGLKHQVSRAREYLKDNIPQDGSEPCLEWCIISDLVRIIRQQS